MQVVLVAITQSSRNHDARIVPNLKTMTSCALNGYREPQLLNGRQSTMEMENN